jgi:hypothetical protein
VRVRDFFLYFFSLRAELYPGKGLANSERILQGSPLLLRPQGDVLINSEVTCSRNGFPLLSGRSRSALDTTSMSTVALSAPVWRWRVWESVLESAEPPLGGALLVHMQGGKFDQASCLQHQGACDRIHRVL